MNDTGYFRDGATTAHRNVKSAEISALQASPICFADNQFALIYGFYCPIGD